MVNMANMAKAVKALPLSLLLMSGCMSGPAPGNPLRVDPPVAAIPECPTSNPLWVPQRPEAYVLVFDTTYDVLQEYFDIARSDRFAGEIYTKPYVVAGLLDGFRFGFYDKYELTESTFQTIRRYAEVTITPADSGGYYVDLKVFKELEDLSRPSHASTGSAILRYENRVERAYEVVDPLATSRGWIPIGQDHAMEQMILARLKELL